MRGTRSVRAIVAMEANGQLRWWDRLYRETPANSPPDQYVDAHAGSHAARMHGAWRNRNISRTCAGVKRKPRPSAAPWRHRVAAVGAGLPEAEPAIERKAHGRRLQHAGAVARLPRLQQRHHGHRRADPPPACRGDGGDGIDPGQPGRRHQRSTRHRLPAEPPGLATPGAARKIFSEAMNL